MRAPLKKFIIRLIWGVSIYLFILVNISYAKIMGGSTTGTITKPTTLKVVLVQFADVHWDSFYNYSSSKWVKFDKWHQKSAFVDLLASKGSFFNVNADGDPVHGSFRDYFWAMSRQNYDPTVTVLNNPDANGYPIWVTLSGNKTSYDFFSFLSAARTAAAAAGYDVTTSSAVRVCYVYAGRWCSGIDVATTLNGPEMAVPERDPWNRAAGEAQNAKLGHIGYYCHEFVHMMGAAHSGTTVWYWCLMRSGHNNGDDLHANRPAPMNPWILYKAGWASPTTLNNDLLNADLIYSTSPTSPSTYYVRLLAVSGTDERLLVENRQLTNTYDQSLPPAVVTPPKSGGILIWRIKGDGLNDNQTDLILADNDPGTAMENQAEDVFRPDGTYPYHKIFDYSLPANLKLSDGTLSHFVVDDYYTNGNTINIDFKINYLSSNSSIATAFNNSRKLVRDSSGKYHLVYEADGEIYYQYSTDGGTSWSGSKRLSPGTGNTKYPSIAESSGNLYVVWQWYRADVNSHYIYFCRSINGGLSWSGVKQIASNVGISDPLPVIASPATNELMIVYRASNNLEWKRSTNNGNTWPSSGTITAGTGEVLNSPSITATRLPWSTNVVGLAYATKEIPNASHIITRYFYNGTWSSANNISSGLPGYLSQHVHPSVSHSGDASYDCEHVAWDAFSSYYQSRVIIHRKGTTWGFGSQYWELHYQEEDRPSISGLTGTTAQMAYQRGTNFYHFTAHFDGSGWSVQFPPISGFHPSFSMGNTSAKYVWTSGSSSPYTINISATTFSKPVVNDSQQVVYQRSVAIVDTVTGGWFDVRVEQMAMTTTSLTSDDVAFVDIPGSLSITPVDGFNVLSSHPTFVPTTTESLIVCYLIGGEKLSAVKNPATTSVSVELQIVITDGSILSIPVYTTNSDMIAKQEIKAAIAAAPFAGKQITIKTQVSGIASKSALVASLGHIYQIVDTEKDAPPIYATMVKPPENCELQAYPNPFNPNTEIRFALREAGVVTVRIYNIQGQLVKEILNQYRSTGDLMVRWDGKNAQGNDLASGIYVCQIKAGALVATQKLMLIR